MSIILLNDQDPVYSKTIEDISPNIILKRHQLTSLQRCIDLENQLYRFQDPHNRLANVRTKIGILGDKVGSGKSYIILALFLANKQPLVNFGKVNVFGNESMYIEYQGVEYTSYLNMNVIVCSFSLIDQWTKYIEGFSDVFNLQVVNKKTLLKKFTESYENCNMLLVSSSFYQYVASFFHEKGIKVKRVVFDEADTAPTVNASVIPASFYWFVTATYRNIIDPYPNYNTTNVSNGIRNMFVKTTFMKLIRSLPYIDQHVIKGIVVRNHDDYIQQSFDLPDMTMRYIECTDHIAKMLSDITQNEHIIRAVHAGDLNSAIKVLKKNNTGDIVHIINLVKEDLERELNNARSTLQYYESIVLQNGQHQQEKIQQAREEEANIQKKINMLKERITNSTICNICFCEPDTKCLPTCCKNMFCLSCMCTWLKINKSCPTCKAKLECMADQLMVINDDNHDSQDNVYMEEPEKLTKPQTLSKLMKHIFEIESKPKVLIFSEYEGSFATVPSILNELNVRHGMLIGQSLRKNLEKYREDELDVLMINSRSFGSGLNLENTTDIVMYHKLDEEIEKQVIGRAQRPGRQNSLRVWYIINDTEISTLMNNNINVKQFYFRC